MILQRPRCRIRIRDLCPRSLIILRKHIQYCNILYIGFSTVILADPSRDLCGLSHINIWKLLKRQGHEKGGHSTLYIFSISKTNIMISSIFIIKKFIWGSHTISQTVTLRSEYLLSNLLKIWGESTLQYYTVIVPKTEIVHSETRFLKKDVLHKIFYFPKVLQKCIFISGTPPIR